MTRSPRGSSRRHRDPGVRGDLARVDQRGRREHLLDRAGLVDVAQGPGAEVLLRRQARVVRVEGRVVGQRQQLPGVGVHHDRRARRAARALDGLAHHALGVPLHVAVDGQVEVVPALRRHRVVVAERDAVAAAGLVGGGAVLAGQHRVEHQLRALAGVAVGVHEADQVRRDVVGGVGPDGVAAGVDTRVAARLDRLDDLGGLGRRDPAGDVLELRVRLAQPGEQVEVVDVETTGDDRGDLAGVLHRQRRVGDDHQAVDGLGERHPVAVLDGAPVGREGHRDHALGAGLGDVRLRVDALQLEQPRGEDGHDHRDQDEADPQPDQGRTAQRAQPGASAALLRPRVPPGTRSAAVGQRWLPCCR